MIPATANYLRSDEAVQKGGRFDVDDHVFMVLCSRSGRIMAAAAAVRGVERFRPVPKTLLFCWQ